MEIERKYLIDKKNLPEDFSSYPFYQIEQAYLCTDPVVRIRRQNDSFFLTYKAQGQMIREEYNLPLNNKSYTHLLSKADGRILTKKRYLIPIHETNLTIELDVFEGEYQGLILAEVEFSTKEEAEGFTPPAWFGREVTFTGEYQNSVLAMKKEGDRL